ncbi:MAG: HEPN domain-containing protein [Candidatus Lokiarchaeota archaeon]|nr:HEPN domain-containing protein [Candidatus Lokiarchaeota archaeon]
MKSKEKVDLFFERAENFLKGAQERFEDRDWDLACFMAEQSAQLYLKAFILEKTGDFPKTHSIKGLFGTLYNLTKDNRFKYDRQKLRFLEAAYFNARYFTISYDEKDAEDALKIVKEVKKLVGSLRSDKEKK